MQMNAAEYRESLRRCKPRVWVDGERIECVADAPQLRPGINAMGVTYDYALREGGLAVTHEGSVPLPYGLGLHPWLPRDRGPVLLEAPAILKPYG